MFQLWPLLVVMAMDDESAYTLRDVDQFACARTGLRFVFIVVGKDDSRFATKLGSEQFRLRQSCEID